MGHLNALIKQFEFDSLASHAQELGHAVYKPIKGFILQAGRVTKDAYAVDVAFRLVSETIKLVDLEAKTECVAKRGMGTIADTRNFYDATRVLQSVHYIASGSLKRDVIRRNVVSVIAQVGLAIGRAISTLHWFASQKLVDFDAFVKKAAAVGGKIGNSVASSIRSTNLMNGAFLVGLASLVYLDVQAINKGEHVLSHTLSTVSLTADIASITLGFANITNPNTITTLAIVAAATALGAWLSDPLIKM